MFCIISFAHLVLIAETEKWVQKAIWIVHCTLRSKNVCEKEYNIIANYTFWNLNCKTLKTVLKHNVLIIFFRIYKLFFEGIKVTFLNQKTNWNKLQVKLEVRSGHSVFRERWIASPEDSKTFKRGYFFNAIHGRGRKPKGFNAI